MSEFLAGREGAKPGKIDVDGDGVPDIELVDTDGDGRPDIVIERVNGVETISVDLDGDGVPDRVDSFPEE